MRPQFLLSLVAILPVHAEWNRYLLEDARDARTDTPPPNTRAYFAHDAYLQHCENCIPQHKSDIQGGGSRPKLSKSAMCGGLASIRQRTT
jgi:hypothetical protein